MKKASFGEKVFGGKIFTIPNLMSMFRLVLIPVILILYIKEKYVAAGVTFLISGITDVIDGWVARRFNMVSDLGKALDPAADKLTQAAALLCISFRHNEVIPLMVLFFFVQIIMALTGIHTIQRTGKMVYARWYGKFNTVLLTVSIVAILLFRLSGIPLVVITAVCFVSGVVTLTLYMIHYGRMIKSSDLEDAKKESVTAGSGETPEGE